MKYKKTFLFFTAAIFGSQPIMSQTTLSVGDISFLAAEGDTNVLVADSVTIVPWITLDPGTVIKFTDNGMANATGTAANNSEHAWTFTVGSNAIAAGTTLNFGYASPTSGRWNGPTSGTTSLNLGPQPSGTANPGISTSGDQIFVYQGTGSTSNIANSPVGGGAFSGTLIAGINFGNTIMSGTANSNSTHAPTSLVNGNAYVNGGNFDNGYYNGIRTGLSNAFYRAATNNIANFTFTETLNPSYDRATTFTIAPTASIHWDADGTAENNGGAGTWDTTTQSTFKDSAAGSTYLPWVNSSTGNDHTAVFGGTAGTVTVAASGVTASGLTFAVRGYTIADSTVTLAGTTPTISVPTAAHVATINSTLAGSNGLTKSGSGSVVLGGTNTYTGTTSIDAGTLLVNGNTSTSAFSVASTGTLGGAGTVGGLAVNGGTIAPGDGTTAIGTLKAGTTTVNLGSIFKFDLAAAGVSDLLDISGSFNKGTGSGTVAFNFMGTPTLNVAHTLVSWTVAPVSAFALADFTFTGLASAGEFKFVGNSLQFTAIPEASNLLIGGLVGLGFLSRRRKQA